MITAPKNVNSCSLLYGGNIEQIIYLLDLILCIGKIRKFKGVALEIK